jgi:hypothetical protein
LTNDFNNGTTLAGEEIAIGTHTITWTALDEAGNSVECRFTINVTDTSTGISDGQAQGVNVYPNPVRNTLYVETGEKNGRLLIIDLTGKVVVEKEIKSDRQKVDVSRLNPGVYLLKIESKDAYRVVKIFKR